MESLEALKNVKPNHQNDDCKFVQNHRLVETGRYFMLQLYISFGRIFYFSSVTTLCLCYALV